MLSTGSKLTEVKGEIDEAKITIGGFNIIPIAIDRKADRKSIGVKNTT